MAMRTVSGIPAAKDTTGYLITDHVRKAVNRMKTTIVDLNGHEGADELMKMRRAMKKDRRQRRAAALTRRLCVPDTAEERIIPFLSPDHPLIA